MQSMRPYVVDACSADFKEHLLKEHENANDWGRSIALSIGNVSVVPWGVPR
jgi:hypothetical protein